MTPLRRRAAGAAIMWLGKYRPEFTEQDVRQAMELYLAGHQAALENVDLVNPEVSHRKTQGPDTAQTA